ncbi:MAG: hypothetical protein Q7T80_05240 [Methanoregula sp.]|nr:hypothetical protein [Methanoregula sp.]
MQGKEYPNDHSQHTALFLIAVIMVSILLVPLVSAEESSLTRGSRFTITVTGTPNTPYYVWLTRTYTMSGEPGDQPPILVANQANIVKDPVDGPYVIGSYQYNNGGGRTIIDDVAPTTASMSDTQYYALVTTGTDGRAIVAFQTSSNTAMRTFSVKVENQQSAAKDNIQVQRGDVAVKRGSVGFDTVATLPVRTTVPTMEIPTLTETPTPVLTTAEPLPSPTTTSTPRVPLGIGACFAAVVGAGIIARRKSI